MVLIGSVLIGVVLPQFALAACGYEAVSVSGTVEETADACRALDEVLLYFKKIGIQPAPVVSISFQDQVYIDTYPHTHDPTGGDLAGKNEVSGCYNFRGRELQITSGRRDFQRERRPWGIAWGQSIAYSILEHELVHAIVANLLGSKYQKISKAWHEFIAYSVQLDLMDSELKRKVLANYPDAKPFQFPENVNPIVYAADPDEFGVSAYLYTEAKGGPRFIGQILQERRSVQHRGVRFSLVLYKVAGKRTFGFGRDATGLMRARPANLRLPLLPPTPMSRRAAARSRRRAELRAGLAGVRSAGRSWCRRGVRACAVWRRSGGRAGIPGRAFRRGGVCGLWRCCWHHPCRAPHPDP